MRPRRVWLVLGIFLNDPDIAKFHTPKLYDDTHAVSKGCKDIFLELSQSIKKFDDSTRMSLLTRLQWPLDSHKLIECLKVPDSYNNVLRLMLAVLQIVEGRRAAYEHFHHSRSTVH